jgi:hypothetical protein
MIASENIGHTENVSRRDYRNNPFLHLAPFYEYSSTGVETMHPFDRCSLLE